MLAESNMLFTIVLTILFIVSVLGLFKLIYKHASNDLAYVRTGKGDEVVALNTAVFVLPILHHATPVNLKTIQLEIELIDNLAVLTSDYMRIDLSIDFYVKVIPERQAISKVARNLGNLTLDPIALNEFFASQLIHTVRKVAANVSMAEIHKNQGDFVEKIQQEISVELGKNCMVVEHVTLKYLNQSAIQNYSEDNAFDAEGLSLLTKIVENEKTIRKEIERENILESKEKDLDMEKLIIDMENKKNRLRSDQEREGKIFEASNALAVSQDEINKRQEQKQSKILAKQALEVFKHQAEIDLSVKLRENLKQQIETDLIKAEAVKASINVELARKYEKADNEIQIKLLKEKRKNQQETAKFIEIAEAKKNAASIDAEAVRIKAEGEAEKLKIIEHSKLEAEKLFENNLINRYQNEAEGLTILMNAFASLSKNDLPSDVHSELISLFSGLCLGNNQLIKKFGFIELDDENHLCSIDPNLVNRKSRRSDQNGNKSKLQAILDEARDSLSEEALNTINGSGNKNQTKSIEGKEKV